MRTSALLEFTFRIKTKFDCLASVSFIRIECIVSAKEYMSKTANLQSVITVNGHKECFCYLQLQSKMEGWSFSVIGS